jgi:hypothetical protein
VAHHKHLSFTSNKIARAAFLRIGTECKNISRRNANTEGLFNDIRNPCDGMDGHVVTDASLAALAIEPGYELVATDTDFARLEGLHWRRPLSM